MFHSAVAMILLLAPHGTDATKPTTTAVSRERIERLIEQLDDDQFLKRAEAAKKLAAAGKDAIEQLAVATSHERPEVRASAESILLRLAKEGEGETQLLADKALQSVIEPERLAKILEEPRRERAEQWLTSKGARLSRSGGGPIISIWLHETASRDSRDISSTVERLRYFPHLASVGLQGRQISDESLKHLKDLSTVRSFYISNTRVSDEGLKHIARLKSLTSITLTNTEITGIGFAHFKEHEKLYSVSASHTKVSDEGLVSIGELKSIRTLQLDRTQISDAGLANLAKIERLSYLSISHTGITDAGLVSLAALKSLRNLNIRDTKVTDAGVAEFKKKLPNCRLQR